MGWDCMATFLPRLHKQGPRLGGPRRNPEEFLPHEERPWHFIGSSREQFRHVDSNVTVAGMVKECVWSLCLAPPCWMWRGSATFDDTEWYATSPDSNLSHRYDIATIMNSSTAPEHVISIYWAMKNPDKLGSALSGANCWIFISKKRWRWRFVE